jgi:hypothetical protein
MSKESLVRARKAQAEVRARMASIYECRAGDPAHRIVLFIPVQGIECPHGKMRLARTIAPS